MDHPTISIIVPVYRVEAYLRKCVDSILAQTYPYLQVFLVDDGSPDQCGPICDEYAAKDSRITVIHQENRGLSAARNAALDLVEGQWIGFVDSDDWIEPSPRSGRGLPCGYRCLWCDDPYCRYGNSLRLHTGNGMGSQNDHAPACPKPGSAQ